MKYTTKEWSDGFGAQYQRIIAAYIFCKLNDFDFYYNPLLKMEHNYDNDDKYIEKKEELINLKKYIPIMNSEENYIKLEGHNLVNFLDQNIDYCVESEHMKFLKKCFWENKNKNIFNNTKKNIAIHIRRPNKHDTRIDGSNTHDKYYLDIIIKIKKMYNDENLLFHIYSQGNIENFKIYSSKNVVFHINEDVENTFIGLVAADILVTSRSSLSYTAALLSDGIVYYNPFWHKPYKNWIIC